MRITRIIIDHDNLQEIAKVAVQYMGKEYTSVTDEMIVIGTESFKLRTSSSQWNMVVLKRNGRKTQIDIIGTAGGIGLLNFSWWSESGFTKGMHRHFDNYCGEKGYKLEVTA